MFVSFSYVFAKCDLKSDMQNQFTIKYFLYIWQSEEQL